MFVKTAPRACRKNDDFAMRVIHEIADAIRYVGKKCAIFPKTADRSGKRYAARGLLGE